MARGAEPLVVLVGRPNAGKSSFYNAVTGGNAHVGNFPGVTVDILEAEVELPGGRAALVADLPGLYSVDAVIDPATDEGIARGVIEEAIASQRELLVVQVVDSTQLALGLRLTRELAARPVRLLVVATQRDALEGQGRTLDADALARAIDVPVVAVSARDPRTRASALEAFAKAFEEGARARATSWKADALARSVVTDAGDLDASMRRRRAFTATADAWLLHPVLGPILFLALMASIFAAVFLVADPVTEFLDGTLGAAGDWLSDALGGGWLGSLVNDGLVGGAGTVLAFMPQIVILTLAMELLEASGYLARGAFLVDRLLRLLGSSGRSFFPLLMGHACAVPAISATRIIRDPRERLTTILVLPLMACSARIPTYALILSTFFAAQGALFRAALFVLLYFAGILSGLIASLILRRTATRGRSLPLVLEMPPYRAPEARVVARKAWQGATRFLREIGTVILAASAALWFLLTVPLPGQPSPDHELDRTEIMERSIGASVGRALEPVTRPLGFDWRINVGLIGSFGARELMVGTLGIIYGMEDVEDDTAPLAEKIRESKRPDGRPAYAVPTGLALLAFFVYACQCMSTVAAIRRETKSWRWPLFVLGYTYAVGYVAALVAFGVGSLFYGR